MKSLTLALAFLATLAVPAAAQRMGMANRNAPTIEQQITFHTGASLQITYTSLNWAQGKFMENVSNERFRTQVNDNAKQNPLGTVVLSHAMTIGGKAVAAGEYGLHFLLSDDGKWVLTLSHKNTEGDVELIQWPLSLEKSMAKMTRLTIGLSADESVTACQVHLMFGDQYAMVPAACAEEK